MIEDLIAKLNAELPELKTVSHAYTMQPLEDIGEESPALYLYPGEESAAPSRMDNFVNQQLSYSLILFLVCNISDVESLKLKLRKSLLGYQPTEHDEPFELIQGKPQDLKVGFIWWQEIYGSKTHLRQS